MNKVTMGGVLLTLAACATANDSASSDWREPEPRNLLYMQLQSGTVVIEMAPAFAPRSVANIRTLATQQYYDGLAIIRSQDNYVVQWGDPAEDDATRQSTGTAALSIDPEFVRPLEGLEIEPIDSRDAYAENVGFVGGFPMASDGSRAWLTHCYAMVGVARGTEPDSGNGTSLYVITGHAPRHLDRNITLVGRVLAGIENLTALPRGNGPLGFYESAAEMTPITRIRTGDSVTEGAVPRFEVMRTDSESFRKYVENRTHRNEEWFVDPVGRIEICNLHPPVRPLE